MEHVSLSERVPVFVRLDDHSKSVQVCVVDAQGAVLVNRRCGNSVLEIGAGRRVMRAAIERCCGAADLADGLIADLRWSVNPAHPEYVARMKHNPDRQASAMYGCWRSCRLQGSSRGYGSRRRTFVNCVCSCGCGRTWWGSTTTCPRPSAPLAPVQAPSARAPVQGAALRAAAAARRPASPVGRRCRRVPPSTPAVVAAPAAHPAAAEREHARFELIR